jgi:small subunit ribosomal protein S4
VSEYGIQLKEKQKVRFVYGVLERQFKRTYKRAESMPGMTGENLLRLMELRLDNVVFRLGLAKTRIQARQMVNHGHILINGKRVDIPSYEVQVGDEVGVRKSAIALATNIKFSERRALPPWLSFSEEAFKGTVAGLPSRNDIDFAVQERAIVELYSK